ncbi:MAG: helix-turn-helix domain-containing protein [Lachnospiraceae bacterium]|nr:helix-turn-helix domain-containing protein [Lachnospiraceae bacterium]
MYQILRGGCGSKHTGAFHMSRPEGLPCYVLLNVRTGGDFHIAGKSYQVTPGTVMIISPGTSYSYTNPSGDYMDDWLHFRVFPMGTFSGTFPHLNIPIPAGASEVYTTLLRQLLWEHSYTPAPYAQENIDRLFAILLNHLRCALNTDASPRPAAPYADRLRAIRLDIQSDPTNTADIAECARHLGISESYFQHIYTQLFGTSYQKDVISFRTEHAKNLLLTTNLSMEQVAELCGYNSPVHFYRQFKKLTGNTPASFRRNNK